MKIKYISVSSFMEFLVMVSPKKQDFFTKINRLKGIFVIWEYNEWQFVKKCQNLYFKNLTFFSFWGAHFSLQLSFDNFKFETPFKLILMKLCIIFKEPSIIIVFTSFLNFWQIILLFRYHHQRKSIIEITKDWGAKKSQVCFVCFTRQLLQCRVLKFLQCKISAL